MNSDIQCRVKYTGACRTKTLTCGDFVPQETSGNVWGHFWVSKLEDCIKQIIAKMQLNLLQCTGQPPTKQRIVCPMVDSVMVPKDVYVLIPRIYE